MSGLSLTWVAGAEIPAETRTAWIALMGRSRADICLDPDWIAAWAAGPGAGQRLLRLEAREEGRLVAVLPFAIARAGPLRARIARLAGSDPNAVLMRLPAEEDAAVPALAAALTRLMGAERCLAASFTPVSEGSPAAEAIAGAVDAAGLGLHDEGAGTHTLFRLPESFEAYLAARSKKRRNQLRRDLRQLEAEHDLVDRSVAPDRAAFEDFRAFHDAQWQAAGKGGHFADWPGSGAFHGALTETLSPRGIMRLEELRDGDRPLASQLAYVSGGISWWRLPARSLEPRAEELGLGRLGLVRMIARMIEDGVTEIEGGPGAYGYKLVWGGEAVGLQRMLAARRPRGLGLKALLAWADLVHLVYYRAWFLKLAPKLSLKPRPLKRIWIRTRI